MGNCLFGGALGPIDVTTSTGNDGDADGNGGATVINVVTTNGGIMEFSSPVTVEFIIDEFPGHGIFPGPKFKDDVFVISCWYNKKPLPRHQLLEAGESYYLLPLGGKIEMDITCKTVGHSRSNSASTQVVHHHLAPYRMSFDSRGILKRSQTREFSPFGSRARKSNGGRNGFWKVKLVISPQQLLDILSQEAQTEELIESVRTVAKSGRNVGRRSRGVSPMILFSEQWSAFSGTGSSSSGNSRRYDSFSTSKDDTLVDFF